MDYPKIIAIEPGKRSGQPCIRGMRITVGDVLVWLNSGLICMSGAGAYIWYESLIGKGWLGRCI